MTPSDAEKTLPLNDVMLAMDVVDTLRHRQDLVVRELDGASREKQLVEKLREIYHQQGIDVPDHILKQGVDALAESRFVYTPPKPGIRVTLAKLYVSRKRWGRWIGSVALALVIAIVGYQFAYLPFQRAQAEAAQTELTETLPAQMQALHKAIVEETKVQSAVAPADELLARGQIAASEGDRTMVEAAVSGLTELRDTIRAEYTLRVVNREGVQSGFWTFPEVNTDATNFYLVVEAIDRDGNPLELPILNEESGETELVSIWGVRVPEIVYNGVAADKSDDGIIQGNLVGRKQYGYLDLNYTLPVLGGTVTRW